MKRACLSFLFLWMGVSQPLSRAATPDEQSSAFFARGLAAEQRGDFIAAENCYQLTLRLNPGHTEATARLADFERRNVVGTRERASILTLPELNYSLRDMSDADRETKFLEILALLNRLTGIEFSLDTEGEPIRSHWLNYSNITVEEAMRKIAQYSGLAVSYDRDVIRLSPKSAATEASPDTREKLARLEERFQTELASMTEPRRENLEKLGATIDAEFAALAEAVKATPNDLAAVKGERSKAAYTVRSEIFRGQPGSFTQDAEGWTLFDTKGGVTQPVAYNKLGYVDGKDLIQSSDYYFSAPQSVLDLLRAASTNDSISFDFYTTASDEGIKDTLVLESPGITLVLPASNPPIREWKRYTYRFDPSEGWKVGTIGKIGKKPAKAEEIRKAMATATKLYIRGEWKTGPDAARLDNVVITSGAAPTSPPSTETATAKPAISLTSVVPFAPDEVTPAQPDPKTNFNGWLKTIQLKHGNGDGVIWSFEDGVVLHFSQKDPNPKVQRFEILSVDAETRTVTWKLPGAEHSIRIGAEFKKFELKGKGSAFIPQALAIEPRDPKIFDGKPGVQPVPAPASTPEPIAPKPSTAPPVKPQENSLGMKFVPVPGSKVLFCIHETRRQDYAAFAAAVQATDETWKTAQRNGVPCGHLGDHPVVGVSRDDARKFCDWLSKNEGKVYRLPSDEEWSLAVGVAEFENRTKESTPELLNMKEKTRFPWGENYPPGGGEPVGNYADTKWKETFPSEGIVEGYTDHFDTTAPVMSFNANSFGLFDLGGNVWEWIDDPWQGAALGGPVVRGAAYNSSGHGALLSSRRSRTGLPRPPDTGFRVVLEVK